MNRLEKHIRANFSNISPDLFKNDLFKGNITKDENQRCIPENVDVLCVGFPCRQFSQAGLKIGFNETRGTLFLKLLK